MAESQNRKIVSDCQQTNGSDIMSVSTHVQQHVNGQVSDGLETGNQSVLDHYKKLQWLQAEVYRQQVMISAQQYSHSSGATQDNATIQQRIEELQKELKDLSVKQTIKDYIQRSLQLQNALESELTSVPTRDNDLMLTERDSKLSVKSLTKQNTELVSDALRIKMEVQALKPNLDQLKQDSLVLKEENCQLMHRLRQMREARETQKNMHDDNDQVQSLQNDYDEIADKLELLKNCFQGLICGSAINWAQDDDLRKLVLDLGQTVDELIKH